MVNGVPEMVCAVADTIRPELRRTMKDVDALGVGR